jgi:hypothetical protein
MTADDRSPPPFAADGALRATPPVVAQKHSPDENLYHGKSEAAAEGVQVVNGLRSGVFATIDACVRTEAQVSA